MTDAELATHITTACTTDATGRQLLTCEAAHQLAARLSLPLVRIGAFCHANAIKITHCQLGCFGSPRG